jgi:hypothetical protein
MSSFGFGLLNNMSRADHMDQLRQWSSEMKVPTPPQTKPTRSELSPVSPKQTRRLSVWLASRKTDVNENYVGVHDGNDVAFDEENNFAEGDALVLQQIGFEEKLLEVWKHGPPQLAEQQLLRISILEEKLATTQADNVYLESLLQIRDMDFARYLDLERQQRKRAGNLEEKVDSLEDLVKELKLQLSEKDKSLKLALDKLDTVKKADRVSKELAIVQQQLAKSSVALVFQQKRTKLVTVHAVKYVTTKPRPQVLDEMALAEKREWERKRLEQKSEITALVAVVDRIAARYDRYENVSTIINLSESRSDLVPDHLFTWVEKDMIALWLYSVVVITAALRPVLGS